MRHVDENVGCMDVHQSDRISPDNQFRFAELNTDTGSVSYAKPIEGICNWIAYCIGAEQHVAILAVVVKVVIILLLSISGGMMIYEKKRKHILLFMLQKEDPFCVKSK